MQIKLPALQSFVGDVGYVIEILSQFLNSRVSGVDDEDVVSSVDCDAAGLHESFLLCAASPENDQRRVVLGHVEEQRTIFDRTIENQNL